MGSNKSSWQKHNFPVYFFASTFDAFGNKKEVLSQFPKTVLDVCCEQADILNTNNTPVSIMFS